MEADNTQPIEMLNRNNFNIPRDVTAHATVNCPQEGLTIGACSSSGTTNVYASGTSSPNSANFDKSITVMAGTCRDMFVGCSNGAGTGRRRRQEPNAQQRIFVTIEGVEEENEYDLSVTPGDSSTPQGMCTPDKHCALKAWIHNANFVLRAIRASCTFRCMGMIGQLQETF